MAERMNRKAYQQSLPKKRISAGCLFFDSAGRLLIVKPTYKDNWEIPGGAVNANESPLSACIREVREELALSRRPLRLLSVDFTGETKQRTESLNFIFDGGELSEDDIAAIHLPEKELHEYRVLPPDEALPLLNRRLRRRVARCLEVRAAEGALYLEGQKSPWAASLELDADEATNEDVG
jgi:8-oxo-dGTP pyrophosphatase MutT (NUDIX family)